METLLYVSSVKVPFTPVLAVTIGLWTYDKDGTGTIDFHEFLAIMMDKM